PAKLHRHRCQGRKLHDSPDLSRATNPAARKIVRATSRGGRAEDKCADLCRLTSPKLTRSRPVQSRGSRTRMTLTSSGSSADVAPEAFSDIDPNAVSNLRRKTPVAGIS